MKQNELKNAFRKPPQEFHSAVISALDSIEAAENVKSRNFKPLKIALVCALVLALGTTSVFAAGSIYSMLAEKKDNYGLKVNIEPASQAVDREYVKMELSYLPEGVEKDSNSEDIWKFSFNNDHSTMTFTFELLKIDEDFEVVQTFVSDYEETLINGNQVFLLNKQYSENGDNTEDLRNGFFEFFEESGMLVMCTTSGDVSDEELIKVISGITLREGTKDDCTPYELYSESAFKDYYNSDSSDNIYKIEAVFNYNLNEIGDKIIDKDYGYTITIDSIDILDNISELNKDYFYFPDEEEFNNLTDENGNITPAVRDTYSYGDGIGSIDKIEKSETLDRKLVYVTVSIANDNAVDDMFPLSNFEITELENDGEKLKAVENNESNIFSTEISYIDNNNKIANGGEYYGLDIPKNTTKTVHLGFLVYDDNMDDLYIEIGHGFINPLGENNFECVKVMD